MGLDWEQSIIIMHKSKLAAKEGVILAKATLESLTITEPATTQVTTTIRVNEGTASAAAAKAAVGSTVIVAEGTMKPAQGTLATIFFCQSTVRKYTNMIERVKAANDLLSKDVLYTNWQNSRKFRDTATLTTGHYF